MSKQTLYVLGILAAILLGALLYPKLCCQDCCEKTTENSGQISTPTDEITKANPFQLKANNFNYSCNDNFKFLTNNFNNIQPVSDSINNGIIQLKRFLDQNPNQKIHITGYSLHTEKNTSAYPDLGIARANDVKNYFISKGLDSNLFETHGELKDSWKMNHDTVFGPISFKIEQSQETPKAEAEDWNAIKEKIIANPLILYFNSNQTEIDLSTEERQKIADLSSYLDHVPNAKISCIGHSDATGKKALNSRLGQNRADFAKNYLIKNGISADKITSSSKGQNEPIADNKTPEGKAKNRRTVITLE